MKETLIFIATVFWLYIVFVAGNGGYDPFKWSEPAKFVFSCFLFFAPIAALIFNAGKK